MDQEILNLDVVGLSDLLRGKKISPKELLTGVLDNISKSQLNSFCYLDDAATEFAERADIYLPFGGIPFGIKQLDPVLNWPNTGASLVFKDRIADYEATYLARLRTAGAVFVGQTTASEFGGINCTSTKINGITRNPWNLEKTPGGSSGGTAAAVSGGLIPIGTGGDGGGSIRIPCAFTGLFGLKVTYGRIPKGPRAEIGALTAVLGCLSRSVRDTARFLDVTNGADTHDPLSLPHFSGYEKNLGTYDLYGLKVVVTPDLFGSAIVNPRVEEMIHENAELLIKIYNLNKVEKKNFEMPRASLSWAMSNTVGLMGEIGEYYPECADDLTPEINFILNVASHGYDLKIAAQAEIERKRLNEKMAEIFDEVDLVITATNPDTAFDAKGPMPTKVGDIDLMKEYGFEKAVGNNGALTIPANMYGSPAITIPVGFLDNMPVGMQVMAKHHQDSLLLDLAYRFESEKPWPRVNLNSPV